VLSGFEIIQRRCKDTNSGKTKYPEENKKQTQDDTFCYYASGRSSRATPAVALREQPVIGYKTPKFIVRCGQRVGDIWL